MAQTTNDDRLSAPGSQQETEGGKAEAARDEAAHLKDTTVTASQQVMETAKDKAQEVADDVRQQTARLTTEAREQVASQATEQRDRTTKWLRSMGDEFDQMAGRTEQGGWGTQLAREGSRLSRRAADFLEQRDPDQLLDEVRDLARRRPGAFLLGAAVAGVVAGRLTRAIAGSGTTPASARPAPEHDGTVTTPATGKSTEPSGTTPAPGSTYGPPGTTPAPGDTGGAYGPPGTAPGPGGAVPPPNAGVAGGTMPASGGAATAPGETVVTGTSGATGATGPAGMGDVERREEHLGDEPLPPPEPTPSVPDPDPGAPVTPRFGPESRE